MLLGVEPDTVILDDESYQARIAEETNREASGARMPRRVVESFPSDLIRDELSDARPTDVTQVEMNRGGTSRFQLTR